MAAKSLSRILPFNFEKKNSHIYKGVVSETSFDENTIYGGQKK